MTPRSLPLAVQLYTLRSLPLDEALAAAARAGYPAVETVGLHDLEPAAFRERLDHHGLRAISTHLPLERLEDVERSADALEALGSPVAVMPYLKAEARPGDADGWRRLGAHLGELAVAYDARGIGVLYHNHDFEMETIDGKTAVAWLLDEAHGSPLGFEADVAWIARGGRDPLELLGRYIGRCRRVHVKDLAADPENDEGGWADVGHGTLDWTAILPVALGAGAEWLITEHDAPRDPAASIARSHAFLSGLL